MAKKVQVKDLDRNDQAWAITIGCKWHDYVWIKPNGTILKRKPRGELYG